MDIVDQTLRNWRSGAFVYGESDCMLSIGHYLASIGARDITALFIGRYDDEAGAIAMMNRHGGAGGLIALTGATLVKGWPQRGDVIELEVGERSVGALCTGDMVAIRLDRGVVEVALRFVSWRGIWRHG